MANVLCPLCGQNAEFRPHQNHDQFWVRCAACGRYRIGGLTRHAGFSDEQKTRLHILSYGTRTASDAGGVWIITQNNLDELLDARFEFSPLEKMDRTLLLINNKLARPGQPVKISLTEDFPLVMARDADEFEFYINLLIETGLLAAPRRSLDSLGPLRLNPEAWGRIEELTRLDLDSDQAFVAMWFDPSMEGAWAEGISPALSSLGFNPYRVDRDPHNDKIDDRIVAEIRRSGLVVADFTGHRGGVYFEAGFAMGLGIPVFWTCRETDINAAHFDTRQYNHVIWSSPEELKDRLISRIAANIPGRHGAPAP